MDEKLNFGEAIQALKNGKKVAREGWNGKGMWLGLIRGDPPPSSEQLPPSEWTFTNAKWDNFPCASFIAMKTATGHIVPWLASQTDVLAEDWSLVA